MSTTRTLLVTSALPYANGPLHLGHLLEHIQTDIWVRTHRMLGHTCISLCGDDAHGTPIMLKAEQLGMTPEALTNEMKLSHEQDFSAFHVHYDMYHTTHSPENEALTAQIFEKLLKKEDVIVRQISQAFDAEKSIFLPDRYVKGACPRCRTPDQYGDNCEACGATYHPTDLIDPRSTLSGTSPIEKTTEHYFFNLPRYEQFLKQWTRAGHLQVEMANKLTEWFEAGLKAWDISRDAPYFGFLIPGTSNKYFYVWLDAPIGYMASCLKYCEQHQLNFDDFWHPETTSELYHFVGKDILYFHALFWPSILHAAEYRLPTAIFTHGFLTINGKKMSKSRGTFIEAKTYLRHLAPEYLRYYFAAKLTERTEDIDLNFEEFLNRINSDLIGKIINIASRSCGFIHKYFQGKLCAELHHPELYEQLYQTKDLIINAYIGRDYAQAMRQIVEGAAWVNQYIDQYKPWAMAKDESRLTEVHAVCTASLNLFRLIMTFLKPVLPTLASATEHLLNAEPFNFENVAHPLLDHTIQPFSPLLQRVTADQIEALLQDCSYETHHCSSK